MMFGMAATLQKPPRQTVPFTGGQLNTNFQCLLVMLMISRNKGKQKETAATFWLQNIISKKHETVNWKAVA